MPIYPRAEITQHGERLLVTSLSRAGLYWPNGQFHHLTTRSSDTELAEAITAALARSREEPAEQLPKAASIDVTPVSDELGFPTWRAMEAATTHVGITLIDGDVLFAPYETVAGRGYSGHPELPPAREAADIATRAREALAEAARLSEKVVPRTPTAATTTDGAPTAAIDDIPNLAEAILTRHGNQWAVQALTSIRADPGSAPNGWITTVPADAPEQLGHALVDALTHARVNATALPDASRDTLTTALGVTTDDLATRATTRIHVQASTSVGDIDLHPQELDPDTRWWITTDHPDSRTLGLIDPPALWGTTLNALADTLLAPD